MSTDLNGPSMLGPELPKTGWLRRWRLIGVVVTIGGFMLGGLLFALHHRAEEAPAWKQPLARPVGPATMGGKQVARSIDEDAAKTGVLPVPGSPPVASGARVDVFCTVDPLTGAPDQFNKRTGQACTQWIPNLASPMGGPAAMGGPVYARAPGHGGGQSVRTGADKMSVPLSANQPSPAQPPDPEREARLAPMRASGGGSSTPAATGSAYSAPAAVSPSVAAEQALQRVEAARASLVSASRAEQAKSGAISKQEFLDTYRKHGDDETVASARVEALSPYEVRAGWVIPAVNEQMINSDLPGTAKARVMTNVYDTATGRFLLIPQNSMLVGKYNSEVSYGQSGLQIVWSRLIYPDGSALNLDGMETADAEGSGGVQDKVDRHYKRVIGFAALTSAMSAAMAASQTMVYGGGGGYYIPSGSDQASAAAARELSQIGTEITRKNLNVAPTVLIRPGARFAVQVNRDLIFDAEYRPRVRR